MFLSNVNPAVIGWIAACVVFLAVEALTTGLSSIWFALGSAAALVCALLGAPLWLQLVWFLIVSVAALYFTRPLVKKYINNRARATNADFSLGRTAVVIEAIDNLAGTGAARLDGKVWTARSFSGAPIPVGTQVTVREIQGVKLMVETVG